MFLLSVGWKDLLKLNAKLIKLHDILLYLKKSLYQPVAHASLERKHSGE